MQKFDLKEIKIDDSRIFYYSNNKSIYVYGWELGEEIFCNFIFKVSTERVFDFVKSWSDSEAGMKSLEKENVLRLVADLVDLRDSVVPVGRRNKDKAWDELRSGEMAVERFNWIIDGIHISIPPESGFKKEDYFLGKEIINECVSVGDQILLEEKEKIQNEIIEEFSIIPIYYENLKKIISCLRESLRKSKISEDHCLELENHLRVFEFFSCTSNNFSNVHFFEEYISKSYDSYLNICKSLHLKPFSMKKISEFILLPEDREKKLNHMARNIYVDNLLKKNALFQTTLISADIEKRVDGHNEDSQEDFLSNLKERMIRAEEVESVYIELLMLGIVPKPIIIDCGRDGGDFERGFEDRKGIDIKESLDSGRDISEIQKTFSKKKVSKKESKGKFKKLSEQDRVKAKSENFSYFRKDFEFLKNRIESIRNFVLEYKEISICSDKEFERINFGLNKISRKIDFLFENTLLFSNDIENILTEIRGIEDANRAFFWDRKNNKECPSQEDNEEILEDFSQYIDFYEEHYENSPIDTEGGAFCDNGEMAFSDDDSRKLTGLKEIIEKKYMADLKSMSEFYSENSSNDEISILLEKMNEILEIGRYAYLHDEHIKSKFDYFENNFHKIFEGFEVYCSIGKLLIDFQKK